MKSTASSPAKHSRKGGVVVTGRSALNWKLPGLLLISIAVLIQGCSGVPAVPDNLKKDIQSADCSRVECIDFIYLHGSRPVTAGGEAQAEQDFYQQIDTMHEWIQAELYNEPTVQKYLLDDGERKINPKAGRFYWGHISGDDYSVVQRMTDWSQLEHGIPGPVARMMQRVFVTGIHDTFWVSGFENARRVHFKLHGKIMKSVAEGREVVLFGHSAGAMAIQTYALYQVPFVNLQELVSIGASRIFKDIVGKSELRTCLRAMLESGVLEISNEGRLVGRLSTETMRDQDALDGFRQQLAQEKLESLPEFTQNFCLPPNALRGLVTYGNPALVLDMKLSGDRGQALFYFVRYLLQNQLFWLNINHIRDPMGYAIYDGDELPEILERSLGLPVVPNGGFFISGSANSGASVLSAHSWYWLKPHQFSKVLAETFSKGAKTAGTWPDKD
jgi:hypothetical protein